MGHRERERRRFPIRQVLFRVPLWWMWTLGKIKAQLWIFWATFACFLSFDWCTFLHLEAYLKLTTLTYLWSCKYLIQAREPFSFCVSTWKKHHLKSKNELLVCKLKVDYRTSLVTYEILLGAFSIAPWNKNNFLYCYYA